MNDHDTDGRTEKVSLHVLLLFIKHLLLLTLVLLLLDCSAVDLTFDQTVRRRAVVPVDVVVRELGILWTERINRKRKVSSSLYCFIQHLSLLIVVLLLL